MPDLCSRFNSLLIVNGVADADCRTEKLKRRLRDHFKDQLQFFLYEGFGKPCIVYGVNTPVCEVAKYLTCLDGGNRLMDSQSSVEDEGMEPPLAPSPSPWIPEPTWERDIFHAAMVVRDSVLSIQNNLPWPPRASDLQNSAVKLPVALYNFLAWVIAG